jgi:Cu2+-containing amine oxidase
VGGTIHNHHLAWKVDLDIAGTANSVRIHEIKMGEADTGFGGKAWVHYYDVSTAEKEDDTAIVSNYATPKLPVVVNENAKNKWGSPRGYKIQVNRVAHELMPEQAPYKKAMGESWRRLGFVVSGAMGEFLWRLGGQLGFGVHMSSCHAMGACSVLTYTYGMVHSVEGPTA